MANSKCMSFNDLRFSNLSPSVSCTPPFTSIISISTSWSSIKPQYPSLSLRAAQHQSICFSYPPSQRMPMAPITTDAALCDFCRPLPVIASNLQSVRDISYYKTFEDLQASGLNGCVLCKWISENFPEYAFSKIHRLEYIARPDVQIFALMYEITDDEKERIREQIRQQPRQFPALAVPVIGLDNSGMVFQTFYCNGRPPASKDKTSGRRICVDPVEAISTVARPWIRACEETHEACRQSKRAPLPSRVLRVGEEGEDVALIDSRDLEGVYTILSYCWGQGTTLKTTSLTLAASMHRIPYENLPLTLRHAVEVTRLLGVKYLWIDALCIIQDQDPPTDWLAECDKMLDYYRNAYVTIGNLDGEASSSGFLFPRKDVSVKIPGNEDLAIRRVSNRQHWSIYDHSVLATRAWCLQERLVSTRLLLFGNDQMFWECRTCCEREGEVVAGERKLDYAVSFLGKRIEELEHEMIQVLASLGSDGMTLRDCMNIWYTIVEQYTSRRLTRATDMLIAISSVANEIQRRTGYDYTFGHWKQDWCKGLVWNRRPGGQATGAPSWSWASKTGLVGFRVLQSSEDSSFNTVFEDRMTFQEGSGDNRELYVRAKCRDVDSKVIFSAREGIIWKGSKTNIYAYHQEDEIDGRHYLELDEEDENLPRVTYKALETLLRYSYTVEAGIGDELLLSGYFLVSYLLVAPNAGPERKWKRIGLGTYYRNLVPKEISFEDLGSENVFPVNQLRPELLFDSCNYEDMCLI